MGPNTNIRKWRKIRGLTQEQLAAAIGIKQEAISQVESGKSSLSVERLLKVAKALDVPPEEFLRTEERTPLIRVTAMPADTNPYGGVFGGWLMGQMGLACGSFVSRRTRGKALLVAADAIKFPGAMAVGDELSVYVELLKEGRTSLRLKAEAVGRQRDSETETVVAEGEFTFVALDDKNQPRAIAAQEESNG